jgi:hypothetical protein
MIVQGTVKGWPIVWSPTTNDAGKVNQCGPDLKCCILGMGQHSVQSFANIRLGQRHEDGGPLKLLQNLLKTWEVTLKKQRRRCLKLLC